MATYTNTAAGLRGINLNDGSTVWVEPGATVEVADADVANTCDGLEASKGKVTKAAAPVDGASA
jgi:hypothetical protein